MLFIDLMPKKSDQKKQKDHSGSRLEFESHAGDLKGGIRQHMVPDLGMWPSVQLLR